MDEPLDAALLVGVLGEFEHAARSLEVDRAGLRFGQVETGRGGGVDQQRARARDGVADGGSQTETGGGKVAPHPAHASVGGAHVFPVVAIELEEHLAAAPGRFFVVARAHERVDRRLRRLVEQSGQERSADEAGRARKEYGSHGNSLPVDVRSVKRRAVTERS